MLSLRESFRCKFLCCVFLTFGVWALLSTLSITRHPLFTDKSKILHKQLLKLTESNSLFIFVVLAIRSPVMPVSFYISRTLCRVLICVHITGGTGTKCRLSTGFFYDFLMISLKCSRQQITNVLGKLNENLFLYCVYSG